MRLTVKLAHTIAGKFGGKGKDALVRLLTEKNWHMAENSGENERSAHPIVQFQVVEVLDEGLV